MNILQFTQIIEAITPTGWEFYASGQRTDYNRDRSVNDTMVLVLPNPYPVWYRDNCSHQITFELWFGVKVDLKRTTTGTQQHNPNAPVELRDTMNDYARTALEALKDNAYITLEQVQPATFYDAPEGQSVNSQVWLQVPITARVWFKQLTE